MNVKVKDIKQIKTNVHAVSLAFMLGVSTHALADAFPFGWQDPLQTRPNQVILREVFKDDEMTSICNSSSSDILNLHAPLLLPNAVDMAMCQNPQIKAAWAAIKIQAAASGEARAAYLPTVNGTISKLRNNTQYTDNVTPESSQQGITNYANFTWRLFDFGTRSANLESASHLLAAATTSHNAAVQKMITSVVAAYFDALTAQAAHKARQESVELATIAWQATKRREANGVAATSDTLQANAALTKAQLALSRAQGDLKKSHSVLLYAMGLALDIQLIFPDDDAPKPEFYKQNLNQWLLDAQQIHPAIQSARSQLLATKAKLRMTQAEGLPYLDFTQNRYRNGYPNQGLLPTSTTVTTVGLTLNVPIFEGFARTYKIRGAQAQIEQSEAQLRDVELQVLMEVVKAHADTLSSIENLQTSNLLLEAANEARQSSQKRYEKGIADVFELISSQNALADAQQERVRCLSEWRSANLRLLANVGIIYRSNLHYSAATHNK
jgi:outer membrane protein